MDRKEILKEVDRVKENLKVDFQELAELEEKLLLVEKQHEQRFYNGQPVLGRNKMDTLWRTGFFDSVNGRHGYFHIQTRYDSGVFGSWDECKPDPDFKSIPNWIEWSGGECPVDGATMVAVKYKGGDTEYDEACVINWPLVETYAAIDLPDWRD